MAIFRVHKNKDYTTIDNSIFKNKNLSSKAIGLLCVMLSLPDDWDYSVEGLTALRCENKSTINSILQELERNKYLVRNQIRNEKGVFGKYVYDIYEEPYTEKSYTKKPCTEKQPQLNTNILNTKKQNTKDKEIIIKKFEKFYLEYPKKVKKYDVEKWFIKNKPNDELFNKIMSALDKFKKTEQWQTKQFIPYPTTWLNQKRWEDEIEAKESVLDILERLEREDEQNANK